LRTDPAADAAPNVTSTPASAAERSRPGERWAALGLLVVVAVGFLVLAGDRITGGFGNSDDGINGAVWATSSQALREEGPLDSALGGRRPDGTRYASHPPLIVIDAALAETVAGERPVATRAPAWLGTLVALGLLWVLLRDLAVPPLRAAAAVLATAGTHMVLVYGAMVDTPVTSLPFGVALVVLWARAWRGVPPPWWAAAGVAALAALSGWQAALAGGLAALALALRPPVGRASLARALPFGLGTAGGAALSLGWGLWTYGSFGEYRRKLELRSGATEGVGLGDVVSFQVPWLAQLLGLGLLALVLAVVALRDPRWRPVAGLGLATVAGYAVLFRGAAAGHQYWLYWALLPVAVGFGYLFGPVAGRVRRDLGASATATGVACVVVAVVVVGIDLTRPDQAGTLVDEGRGTLALVTAAELPDDQDALPYVGRVGQADDWVPYATGRPARALADPARLEALAAEAPDHLVLVLGGCDEPTAGLCDALDLPLLGDDGDLPPPELVPAGALAERLGS
jgi:hypothetical protein